MSRTLASLVGVLLVCSGSMTVLAQDVAVSEVRECASLSLYCMELTPRAEFRGAKGFVELARPPSAYGVAVSRDGHQRFKLIVELSGLPEPSSLGAYSTYVLWAMPLTLNPMINMGEVGNGYHELGEVALNKFMLFVTAEASADGSERAGPLVLRGRSPSSRLEPHDMFQVSAFASPEQLPEMHEHEGMSDHAIDHGAESEEGLGYRGPAMHPGITMMDAMMTLAPSEPAWLPEGVLDVDSLPEARAREVLRLADGDSLTLRAYPVSKVISGQKHAMMGYNGQIPGPLITADKNATIHITFVNDVPFASSVHWHGLRQDNRFDGVPGLTQDAVPPGRSFEYEVHFPDSGLYWYHPHHREEVQQELGLYGNMLVTPQQVEYLHHVEDEEFLVLDDFQVGPGGQVAFGEKETNFALMGRFGNVLMINGEEEIQIKARDQHITRWYITNVSNSRTWNLSVGNHPVSVVASDLGPFARPVNEQSVTIAPAERYVIEMLPVRPGRFPITNRIQSLDHTQGRYFSEVDTLGWFVVEPVEGTYLMDREVFTPDQTTVGREIRQLAHWDDRPADRELDLFLRTDGLPPLTEWILRADQSFFLPVEFSDTMPMMNWSSTGNEVQWVIQEPSTGLENMEIEWQFDLGSMEKIRITNRRDSQHAMQHPIHVHGQRFLVLAYNDRPVEHRVWKDTVLIPAGMTADILVEFTNPGAWMIHCHIAEHLETGMKMKFTVE